MDVHVVPVSLEDKEILRQLLEFNAYEFSRFFDDADLNGHGRFGYRYLDNYWTEDHRHPFLARVAGKTAGMALVRSGTPNSIAEFFVMPRYRRHGTGTALARAVFALFPGDWEVHQIARNTPATEFWRRAIPVAFTESEGPDGITQRFTIEA